MANRKSTERNVRKITKVGKSSFSITLPIELIRKLGWKKNQKVSVKEKRKKLVVGDWKK